MTRRRFPLLILIVLPTAATLLAMVIALSFWVQQTWYSFAEGSYLSINDQVAASIEAQLDAVLGRPEQLLDATTGIIRLGIIGPGEPARFERYLVNELRAHTDITNLSLGTEDGFYVNAYRLWEGPRNVMVSTANPAGALESFHLDAVGNRAELARTKTGFQVVTRPWYRAAIERPDSVWFPPYTFFSGETLAIGMSRAVSLPDGRRGVVAVDVSLHEITRFLSSRDFAAGGSAFIMTPDSDLIADSSGAPSIVKENGQARIRRVEDSTLPDVRRVMKTVLAADGNLSVSLPNGNDSDLVHARRFSRPGGLELIIGVISPRSAYAGTLNKTIRDGMLAASLISLVGLAIIFLIGRAITGPVRELTQAIAKSDADRLPDQVPASRVREIDQLAQSFSRLSERLQSVLTTLEQRVQKRTAALETANQQLERLSLTDELTGLANRRHFQAKLTKEWRRATRNRKPLSLLIGDIDWFKAFNDKNGHPAGDRALEEVARLLKARAKRSSDLVARIGGEEFAFLLPEVDSTTALAFAENLRSDLEAEAIEHRASPLGVITMSFGVASITPARDSSPGETLALVDAADEALYRAKDQGRNQVAESIAGVPFGDDTNR